MSAKAKVVTRVTAKQIVERQPLDQDENGESKEKIDFKAVKLTFKKEELVGKGTFGVVQAVRLLKVTPIGSENSECKIDEQRLAMKTVTVKSGRSRELLMLRKVRHPNIVQLRFFFFSRGTAPGESVVQMLCDLQAGTVQDRINHLEQNDEKWPDEELSVCAQQIGSGISHLHSLGIAHRDIKPRNLLLSLQPFHIQICDLGSACLIRHGEPLTTYICSRFYRAPELLLGCPLYTTAVDMWSLGCVLAEMGLLRPLMAGEDSADQLTEIVELLGAPQSEELENIGSTWDLLAWPLREAKEECLEAKLGKLLEEDYPGLPTLLGKLLKFDPNKRLKAESFLEDEYFDAQYKKSGVS